MNATHMTVDARTQMRFTREYLERLMVDILALISMRPVVGPNVMGHKGVWRGWCLNTLTMEEVTLYIKDNEVGISIVSLMDKTVDLAALLEKRLKLSAVSTYVWAREPVKEMA